LKNFLNIKLPALPAPTPPLIVEPDPYVRYKGGPPGSPTTDARVEVHKNWEIYEAAKIAEQEEFDTRNLYAGYRRTFMWDIAKYREVAAREEHGLSVLFALKLVCLCLEYKRPARYFRRIWSAIRGS
jgi:hypothetical protein